MPPLLRSEIPNVPVCRGKVRDVYDLGDGTLLIVASDRISAFDVIMPTPIPDKGRILTQLSNFWFAFLRERTGGFQDHLLETDVDKFPARLHPYKEQLAGRSVLVRKTRVIPIECVVRGYLAGSGWNDYRATGQVCGISLPAGLRQCERLPEAIFTPSTKAEAGHDEAISFEAAAQAVGGEIMAKARLLAISLYETATAYAQTRGILLADTKFEFGLLDSVGGGAEPILIDEALTPDSSRFWPAEQYEPGRDQASFDKQYLRNYLETLSWGKTAPGPDLPAEVVEQTRRKYVEAYEKLTGRRFFGTEFTL